MTEEHIHEAIVKYLRWVLPSGWDVWHIPNNPRSKIAGARLKKLGMKAGAPDIMILGVMDEKPWVGFAEVKTKTGRLTSEQVKVHDRLIDKCIPVAVLRSVDDARAYIEALGLPSREVRQ